jgi:hypothetical protein
MTYQEIAMLELKKNNVSLCTGQCGNGNHTRGFVRWNEPVIHLDRALATRSTLHRFFHELGHIINPMTNERRYIQEAAAERFASDKLREYGIPVPRKCIAQGRNYVARKKRHGDRIIQNRKER